MASSLFDFMLIVILPLVSDRPGLVLAWVSARASPGLQWLGRVGNCDEGAVPAASDDVSRRVDRIRTIQAEQWRVRIQVLVEEGQ
jgi:hypothetical protein